MPLKKTNGLYRGKVRIGVTQDGKPIDKFVSGKTVKELEVAKEAARDHFIYGRAIPKNVQFFEYAEQWYKLKKEPFISAASRASYKSCFMKHLLPEFGLQNLRAIDAAQIQKFVNQFAGTSKSQITQIIGTLKGIFSSALAEGIIDRDPSASLVCPKAKKKDDRRPLTKEETERVLSVMRTNPEGLLLAVLYYLGVRRGEGFSRAVNGNRQCLISITTAYGLPRISRPSAMTPGGDRDSHNTNPMSKNRLPLGGLFCIQTEGEIIYGS